MWPSPSSTVDHKRLFLQRESQKQSKSIQQQQGTLKLTSTYWTECSWSTQSLLRLHSIRRDALPCGVEAVDHHDRSIRKHIVSQVIHIQQGRGLEVMLLVNLGSGGGS